MASPARRIDLAASADAERKIGKARADQLAEVQELVEATFTTYAEQLRDGRIRLSAADLPRLSKLLNELRQEIERADEPESTTSAAPSTPSMEHMTSVIAALQETNIFGAANDQHHGEDEASSQ